MENEIKSLKSRLIRVEIYTAVGLIMTMIKCFLLPNPSAQSSPQANNQSVKVGEASPKDPQREYLTVQEVADKEGVEARTVITWIARNRIDPPPQKGLRSWTIAANYRLKPLIAENSGNLATQ